MPLACSGCDVTGVDTSDDMMAVCRQRLVKADIPELDLRETLDLVVAPCNLINYFTRPGEGVRVLRTAWLRREETTSTLTYYFPREMRSLLAASGFHVFREQGSIVEDIPIDESAGEMVFFCRKEAPVVSLILPIEGV